MTTLYQVTLAAMIAMGCFSPALAQKSQALKNIETQISAGERELRNTCLEDKYSPAHCNCFVDKSIIFSADLARIYGSLTQREFQAYVADFVRTAHAACG